ncbi:MAG: hypothetical protein IPM16_11120 [Chloroflexi bacterium]|nr:hypothetical protein [Chloroflexota bacterium]
MANSLRVALETGPKGKRVVAMAPDWPGLERGGKTEKYALERLQSYRPRYAKVAKLAGMSNEFAAATDIEVVDTYVGTPSTDFWGISFAFSKFDTQAMSNSELERELALLQACWAFFDDVRSRVSAELQAGPRGGGRNRDRIVRHTLRAEQDWATKVGISIPEDDEILTDEALKAYREDYCSAIREYHAQGKLAGKVAKWPLRFLIRHSAYHMLDHAWEMEDKDLTGR